MALADTIERLPPWALYGGAGVVAGGGYLLYRKRKAAAASAASGDLSGPTSLASTPVTAYGSSSQQSSIAPYYLTADPNATGQSTGRRPPRTPPTSIPTPTGVSGSTLPDIPPLLNTPITTSTPPPPPPAAAPPPPPPPQVTAPPPPAQQVANLPADLLAKIQAGGEHLIGNMIDPLTGGTWWFGSKGGVFAVNGARFLGSARPYGFDDPNVRTAVQAIPLGSGYRIVSSRGETYNFPS